MKRKSRSFKVFMFNNLSLAIILAGLFITSCQSITEETQNSYAEDRALIEDLQARYMFALDFDDLETYVNTFTEDGILDIGEGPWQGRETIMGILTSIPEDEEPPVESDLHPATGRHNITNIVLKIEGDSAWGRAYWFHMSNDNPQRRASLDSYGHYEDVIVKVDGEWLFKERKIFNEDTARWAAPAGNPSW